MAHSPEKRMELRAAYIGGLPLEAAAQKVVVPYATARNWFNAAKKSHDDWDKFRAASLIVAGGGIEQAMGRIIAAGLMRCEALLESLTSTDDPAAAMQAMATLGDTVSKLRAAAKSFMPETSKDVLITETLQEIAAWSGEHAAVRGIIIADAIEGFALSKRIPMAAALENLRAEARAAGATDAAKTSGLSEDSANAIRAKILGVTQ